MSIIRNAKGILMSEALKEYGEELLKDAIGALMKDPVSAWNLAKDLRCAPSAIRDQIFIECFQVFLLNTYKYDVDKQKFGMKN